MSKLNIDPMRLYVASMRKIFRVTHVCGTLEEANEVMAEHSDTAAIAEDKDGRIYLAEQYGSVCPSAILLDMKDVNTITEEEETRRGDILAENLNLKRSHDYPDRWYTQWGTKTSLGLFRIVKRFAEEGK